MRMEESIRVIEKNKNDAQMESLHKIIIDMAESLQECDENCFNYYCDEIYKLAYGETITPAVAKQWVDSMRPYAKWTMEETNEVLAVKGLKLDPTEFYVVMNMMFSDYGDSIPFDLDTYINLSVAWLQDADTVPHKLYNYWRYIAK